MLIGDQEKQVRRWLKSNRTEDLENLTRWLDETPTQFVTEVLARTAMEAGPVAITAREFNVFLLGILPIILYFLFGLIWKSVNLNILPWLFFLHIASAYRPRQKREMGLRAAIRLAELNDDRAIGPLARCYRPHYLEWGNFQEDIENALLKLLTSATRNPQTREFDVMEVQAMSRRIWHSVGLGKELTEERADLLLAALRYLRVSESPEALKYLARVAADSPETDHRRLVQEAAHILLNPEHEYPLQAKTSFGMENLLRQPLVVQQRRQ